MDPSWTVIIGALGGGAVLLEVVRALLRWVGGRASREQTAWDQRDNERRLRILTEDALLATRRLALQCGVKLEELPPLPQAPRTPPPETPTAPTPPPAP